MRYIQTRRGKKEGVVLKETETLKLLIGDNPYLMWDVIEKQQSMIAAYRCVINLLNKELTEAQDTAEMLLDAALHAQYPKRDGEEHAD